jgi:ABC-type branched-subunit amino acid transport system ATPase component
MPAGEEAMTATGAIAAGNVPSRSDADTESVILQTFDLTKNFGLFTAVDGLDLSIRRNTIHALIGPNGAGKTTVFNLLTKFLMPSAGRIVYNGVDITRKTPAEVALMRIARSFQISAIFPDMTARENVRFALQRLLGISLRFWQSERTLLSLQRRADELLDSVGLATFANTPVPAICPMGASERSRSRPRSRSSRNCCCSMSRCRALRMRTLTRCRT